MSRQALANHANAASKSVTKTLLNNGIEVGQSQLNLFLLHAQNSQSLNAAMALQFNKKVLNTLRSIV